ncbi:LCP family protein [Pseudosporangium ferrugineum]|uniref:LytR family transcriptional attenuator n=1 Tax=Pseudosporangium ferrugineum TaxID=439699 RepID=A0A2T0SAX1_9ACTN|nr:LCP family protein [Pseudosporangium ferrugineum]PRY30574.1 LytR family transcriptional attenuator [Pseudosporangium ferrugineum]
MPVLRWFKRRWKLLLAVVVALLVTGSVATVAGARMLAGRYEGAVHRADLLPAPVRSASGKPEPPKVRGPMNLLLIGSDSRKRGEPGDGRSDVIILVHIPKSTGHAYVISIPRDTYLPIATADGERGSRNKVNAAYAWGGAPRLVQTVNQFGDLTVDWPIVIDFAGVRKLTDLVGGVDVVVDKRAVDRYRFLPEDSPYPSAPCTDPQGRSRRCVVFDAGKVHLDGKLAEYYVRQRRGLPNDDFDRSKRHQQYLHALAGKIAEKNVLTDPIALDRLVRAGAGMLTVDRSMPVQRLALTLRGLRPKDLTFMTLPIAENRDVPGVGSVMVPDTGRCRELFTALREGRLDRYVRKYPPNDVSHGR